MFALQFGSLVWDGSGWVDALPGAVVAVWESEGEAAEVAQEAAALPPSAPWNVVRLT